MDKLRIELRTETPVKITVFDDGVRIEEYDSFMDGLRSEFRKEVEDSLSNMTLSGCELPG